MSDPAASTRAVVIERVFPHQPEKVWRALTESPLVAQWLMKNDFEPVTRKKFQFRADPVPNWDGVIDCEVLVVEPLKQLHVIGEVDKTGAQERPDERHHREQEDEPLLVQPAPGIARQDHEPGPAPREGSVVPPISAFVYRHT